MRKAFTLIELLTVIAITAILMTIILVPVIQSFNLTRQAQAFSDAQDKARRLIERITREISQGATVRENSGLKGAIDIVVPARPGSNRTVAGYDTSRSLIRTRLFNAKLDVVLPFEGDPANTRAGAFVNPATGMADPTLDAPKGQITLPVGPGMTIRRYWVGLRNPLRTTDGNNGSPYLGYLEPFSGLLEARTAARDNLYVLYSAEVQPYIWNANQNRFVVNTRFFFDQGPGNNPNDPGAGGPLLDDPTFFDPAVPYPGSTAAAKRAMVQNWMSVAVVETDVSRYDMIQPIYNLRTRQVVYDGDTPRVLPLVQFRPTRVTSEPATAQTASRLGEETDNSGETATDVFLTKYGGWSNALIRFYPRGFASGNRYMVGATLQNPTGSEPRGFSEYVFDPAQGFDDNLTGQLVNATRVGYEVFDFETYSRGLSQGIRANFSRGVAAANARSGWLSNQAYRNLFSPFAPQPNRGRVIFSWGIDEVGVLAGNLNPVPLPDPVYNPKNLPGAQTWPDSSAPLTPQNEPAPLTGNFYDAQYASINKKFNKVWQDHPELRPEKVHRFIDLRVSQNSDGAPSPLHPDPATGFARARIVPGSEQVFGPDQLPGGNYGRLIRYTRTTREPGPNQYRINYTDLGEPDYGLLGLPNPPANYTPTDFVSAVFQPRFKAGYLQLNSDPNVPLPSDDPLTPENEGQILVYYRFQFSQPNDVVAVDYDSRQLMSVLLTVKNHPQSSAPNPQSVTLRATATVRNFLR